MRIKSFLLGSAAALVAVSGARAADAVVVAEPEPVEYVRVCDAYGTGFFYIPGTETCLKVSGYVRYDAQGGDDVYNGGPLDTWAKHTRAEVRFDARSETELGTLRSYIQSRFDFTDGSDDGASLPQAFIELGGFRVGVADEIFGAWNGYAGDIINDDVINYNSWQSNQVSYTFTGADGFSAIVAAEQGSVHDDYPDYVIDNYMPHVMAGAKYEQGWGTLSGIVGYDSNVEAFAAKARLDVNITDTFKVWGMGAYQSDYDSTREERNFLTPWQGDWAAWAGFAAKLSDKATVNGQGAYASEGTYAFALNVAYELVPGFTITPEINYTKFEDFRQGDGTLVNDDALGGIVRFQRNF
ncbi:MULTISPECIES: porin [unclassified Phyllobacterium]|uniref:porin n=1 Tax=Phyllobacterium TaxID=28100 RepID=UPI0004858241|nr:MULTISPECIES: porin [unclassified Phyllobacterium]UGY09054.1 porin [Phyllobacterium sp. T1018]SFI98913.1 Porin subfamily protein [Phyllobacterium sp. CL33Tsu]